MQPSKACVKISLALVRSLDATIGHVSEELHCQSEQCILMGFSQGCLMVSDQAIRGERRFAGVIAISGWLNDTEEFPESFGPAANESSYPVDAWHV